MPALAPTGFGLLGWSSIARRRFLPALRKSARARLVAIGTRDPARAPTTEGWPAGTPAVSYDELLARPDVHAVYVSLPNHLHEEWTLRALAAGKHVLCEKPLAPGLAAVERMVAAAETSGRRLGEAVMFRHHPQHAAVRELLAGGALGRLRQLRTGFSFLQSRPDDFRLDPAGGGACADLLTYVVGAVGLFLPSPLAACTGFARMRGGVDMSACGAGHTASGELFSFSISFEQHYECFYELVGSHGRLRLDRAYTTTPDLANELVLSTDAGTTRRPLPAADHFMLMIDDFCGRLDADPRTDYDALLHAHRQIDLVRHALTPLEASP